MFGHSRRPLAAAVLVSGALFLPPGVAAAAPPDAVPAAAACPAVGAGDAPRTAPRTAPGTTDATPRRDADEGEAKDGDEGGAKDGDDGEAKDGDEDGAKDGDEDGAKGGDEDGARDADEDGDRGRPTAENVVVQSVTGTAPLVRVATATPDPDAPAAPTATATVTVTATVTPESTPPATDDPTRSPAEEPTDSPTGSPTGSPTDGPTGSPTDGPTDEPSSPAPTTTPAPSSAAPSTGSPTASPAAEHPGEVLDLRSWNLTLPTGSPGKPETVDNPRLERFSNEFFRVTPAGDGVAFSADGAGVTTKNSHYPRSELREMDGAEKAAWSNDTGTHTLDVCEAFTKLPKAKPEVVGVQIHDAEDDVLQVRLEGQKLSVEYHDGKSEAVLDPAYELGTPYRVRVVAAGGKVDVFYNGEQKAELPLSGSGWYWKVGAYVQSNASKGDGAGSVGEVVVYSLDMKHA